MIFGKRVIYNLGIVLGILLDVFHLFWVCPKEYFFDSNFFRVYADFCKSWTSHTFCIFRYSLEPSLKFKFAISQLFAVRLLFCDLHIENETWTHQGQNNENNFLTFSDFRFDRLKSHQNHKNIKIH